MNMKSGKNIYIIGPMGVGKSSLGRRLSVHMKRKHIDTDQEIRSRSGVDISWIFSQEGEEGFRTRETQLITELSSKQDLVVSTGGGSIVKETNRKILRESGLIIYLVIDFEEQLSRATKRTDTRPLLETDDQRSQLKKLNNEREEWYEELADFTFRTDEMPISRLVVHVLNTLKQSDAI